MKPESNIGYELAFKVDHPGEIAVKMQFAAYRQLLREK
jgi:hypothetical protein